MPEKNESAFVFFVVWASPVDWTANTEFPRKLGKKMPFDPLFSTPFPGNMVVPAGWAIHSPETAAKRKGGF